MAFLTSICCKNVMSNVGCMVKNVWDFIWLCYAVTATISRRHTNDSQTPDECESHPHSWRLPRALLSKQLLVSWCGLSFPLSWPCYGMGVWGVWEKPVWKRREEVCIYLCWWGMISTLICLQTSSWTARQAAEAIGSLCWPQRVQHETLTTPAKLKVHPVQCKQVQGK